jgi:sarcosine oxidase subunit alpha
MLTVDGEPAVRSCIHPAKAGQQVERSNAWPSADHDVMSIVWRMRWMLPVGFYYKMFIKPAWLWPIAEKYIRRLAGIGPVDVAKKFEHLERLHHHPDVCVIGGGVAGLSAALAAGERGESVVLVEEGAIGEKVAPGLTRSAISELSSQARRNSHITILERAPATGVYEGPLVTAPNGRLLHMIHPQRIVAATGAVELHGVFAGSDLPGVWLGRGAARMAGVHKIPPGKNAVVVLGTEESFEHLEVLRQAGVTIAQVIVSRSLASRVPKNIPAIVDGQVIRAHGKRHLSAVTVMTSSGAMTIACDALVLSLGLVPRDGLLRQAQNCVVNAGGDLLMPGCSLEQAIASGRESALRTIAIPGTSQAALPSAPKDGIVCICEDVGASEIAEALREGYNSTELLKRYTTTTMGPCQGLMCHTHLRAMAYEKSPSFAPLSVTTTARPPARSITLEEAAAGFDHHIEQRTALHERHLSMGGRMGWAGPWKRPDEYGDITAEYWAVRRSVSIMDVGTLGKFRVLGPDATEFLERLYPMHVGNLKEGRSRYGLMLNEAGYIFDDGLVARLAPNEYYLSVTSSGADAAEAYMCDWAETWRLKVHILNLTAALGAINVAGPKSRELLRRLTNEPIDAKAIPYSGLAQISVAGVACIGLRVGFTGELSFELHHASSRSVELWDALLKAGADLGIRAHGLEALKTLRLEKGHIIIGQDTDFDTSPSKVGMDSIVKMEKPYFIGKSSLQRLAQLSAKRRLVPIQFPGTFAPDQGAALMVDGQHVGKLTSSRYSPVLQKGVALGWVTLNGGAVPTRVLALSRNKRQNTGEVGSGPFYDPEGAKLRA